MAYPKLSELFDKARDNPDVRVTVDGMAAWSLTNDSDETHARSEVSAYTGTEAKMFTRFDRLYGRIAYSLPSKIR